MSDTQQAGGDTQLAVIQTAIQEFDRVAAGLGALQEQYGNVVFQVGTSEGMSAAKTARLAIRQPRYDIEHARKEAKAPLIAKGKWLDNEAARITRELEKLEAPIQLQITTEEKRKENERLAAIETERQRVAGIQARIDAIRALPLAASGKKSAEILAQHEAALAMEIGEDFAEFILLAKQAHNSAVAALYGLHQRALEVEAEVERLRLEREELARLRAEQEQRNIAERRRIAEEERVAKEARDAEAEREREALRAEREALATQRAEQERLEADERQRQAAIRAAQETEAQAERDRIAADERRLADERATFERQQEEQRAAGDQMRAAMGRRGTGKRRSARPADSEIIAALATHFRVDEPTVLEWLRAMNLSAAA